MSSPDRIANHHQDQDPLIPKGDTDAFPGNWVNFYGDYCTDGVWSAGGLCCTAGRLPVPDELREKIRAWGFNYHGRVLARERGEVVEDTFRRWYDHEGIDLARQVKTHLPHWVVAFSSEFGAFKTPSGKGFGVISSDGSFNDLSPEELRLQKAICDDDRYI